MNKYFILSAVLTLSLVSLHLKSQVTIKVVKSAAESNPSLFFGGIKGNKRLSVSIRNNLILCGWFELTQTKNAKYLVSGYISEGMLILRLTNRNTRNYTNLKIPITGNINKTSYIAVDSLLRYLFKIKGICNSYIAFVVQLGRKYSEIYICNFAGTGIKRITSNRSLSVEPDWSPLGRSIIYTLYGRAFTELVEYHLVSRRSRILSRCPGINASGAISPSGKILAMVLSKDKTVDLYIKYIGRRGIKRLTRSKSVESSPCWSPSGDKLCFVSDRSGRPQIYIINIRTGGIIHLRTYGIEAVAPSWSGKNVIAYSALMGKNYTIAVTDLNNSSNSKIIVRAAGDWESPSWAPDNRHIVCSRTINNHSSLYVIDTWTGKIRRLLSLKYNLKMPSWSDIIGY